MAPGLVETGLLAVKEDKVPKQLHTRDTNVVPVESSAQAAWVPKKEHTGWRPQSDDDLAVLAVRNLVLDICMQNGGGHGGSALGLAAIGVALWNHVMRFNPLDPEWFDRDRFVLSNGMSTVWNSHAVKFLPPKGLLTASRPCKHVSICHESLGRLSCLDNGGAEGIR
jgi:hypothetical protein